MAKSQWSVVMDKLSSCDGYKGVYGIFTIVPKNVGHPENVGIRGMLMFMI